MSPSSWPIGKVNHHFVEPMHEPLVETPKYRVQAFVAHGFYEYEVGSAEQAMAHAQAIMSTGVYRRHTDDNTVEFHKVYKVKVKSNINDLGSKYGDKFVRT